MKTTLLITTFNRGSLLKNNLERLTYLTIPDEVLVVDDGGTDDTEWICETFRGRLPIKYIYNHNPDWSICSMARNIGVKNCIGDIIITAEPELIFVTDVIKQFLENREKYPNQIISAGTMYFQQSNFNLHPGMMTDPIEALRSEIIEDYIVEPRSYRKDSYVKTVNMQATFSALYEKKWIMDVGGWDEAFPGAWGFDDIDLCTRLRINGINQYIDWDVKCIHQWHPHLPPHLQGPAMFANEKHMQDKKLNEAKKGDPSLSANVGKEWGVIHPK